MIFDYNDRPNFQQLINHRFLQEEKPVEKPVEYMPIDDPSIIVSLERQIPKSPKIRTMEQMQSYIMKHMTLSDDILSFAIHLKDMSFIEYFVAKYFTDKFQYILNLIQENDTLQDFSPQFMEYFFQESERACNSLNRLERDFKNLTADDLSAYSMQMDELIHSKIGAPELFLKILQKICRSLRNSDDIYH